MHGTTHLASTTSMQTTNHQGLCIGPDPAGNLIELLYLQFTDGDLIIHAQALRPVFRTYLTGGQP